MKQNDETDQSVKVLPHNYDGIQELDNPLPRWWLLTFYITIVFAIGYYGYYEVFSGPSSDESLAHSMQKIEAKKKVEVAKVEAQPVKGFTELIADKEMMIAAKKHFATKCAACHGQEGQGVIGPNLADKFWIYSKGDMEGILKAIREGFLEKGMPGWKDMIPAKDQPYLAAYVIGFRGTNPANAKPPQGKEVEY